MACKIRNISQDYWTSPLTPYLTVRTTRDSTQGYKAHYHPELSIGIMLTGQTSLTLGNTTMLLNEGDLVVIEPNMVHACNPVDSNPRSYHMLYIDNQWCCNALSKLFGYEVKSFKVDHSLLCDNAGKLDIKNSVSMLIECESQHMASSIENSILDLLGQYCSPYIDDNSDELAYKVRELLLKDVEHAPQLEAIAYQLGYSPETLIRKFKRQFGITPKSFLSNYRVEKAKVLLKGGMEITDVANELGFFDQSQLHRAFVTYTASTPGQYQLIKSIFDNNE